jgi:hypothetical protein
MTIEAALNEAWAHLERTRDQALDFVLTVELGPKRPERAALSARLKCVAYSNGWEVIELDGRPILRVGPLRHTVTESPGGCTIKYWRDVERVRPGESNDGGTAA